jgi:hypothetical protein
MIGASKSKFRNSDSLRFNCTASVRLRGYLGDRNFLRLAPLIRRILAAPRKMSADEIANHANAVSPRLSQSALDSPRAWLMAVAAFFACFTIFGVVYSFGVFFKPMAAQFGASRAHTSIVFSLTAAIYNLLGLAAGHLSDRFGPRRVMAAGAIAIGAGLFFTASAGSLWFGCVAYGLGVGVGVACWYVPALAVVGGWFLKRRTAALGVAVSGVGCGPYPAVRMARGVPNNGHGVIISAARMRLDRRGASAPRDSRSGADSTDGGDGHAGFRFALRVLGALVRLDLHSLRLFARFRA